MNSPALTLLEELTKYVPTDVLPRMKDLLEDVQWDAFNDGYLEGCDDTMEGQKKA